MKVEKMYNGTFAKFGKIEIYSFHEEKDYFDDMYGDSIPFYHVAHEELYKNGKEILSPNQLTPCEKRKLKAYYKAIASHGAKKNWLKAYRLTDK